MNSYPIETDPEQIIRWLMVERQNGITGLRIDAQRLDEARPVGTGLEPSLDEEDREDLGNAETVATLEIAPVHAREGWRLRVAVEDEIRPCDPDEEDSEEAEEEPIDLDTFYLEFIRPGRGTATVTAEVDGPEAEAHLGRLMKSIETNAHPRSIPF